MQSLCRNGFLFVVTLLAALLSDPLPNLLPARSVSAGELAELTICEEVVSLTLHGEADKQEAMLLRDCRKLQTLVLSGTHQTNRFIEVAEDLPNLEILAVRYARVSERGFARIARLENLKTLSLEADWEAIFDPKDLAQLQKLERLRDLFLDCNPTRSGMEHVGQLKSLESLYLQVLDADQTLDLQPLANLSNLQRLEVSGFSLYVVHLDSLQCLEHLHSLGFSNHCLTDSQLQAIAGCPQLERLKLVDCQVTDAALAYLPTLERLQYLDLSCRTALPSRETWDNLGSDRENPTSPWTYNRITDAGMPQLDKLKDLKELNLANTEITNAACRQLRKLKQLEKLNLTGTFVTRRGVKALQRRLPDTEIVLEPGS